jgi:hypothetical protein
MLQSKWRKLAFYLLPSIFLTLIMRRGSLGAAFGTLGLAVGGYVLVNHGMYNVRTFRFHFSYDLNGDTAKEYFPTLIFESQVEGGHRAILYSRLGGLSDVVKGEGTHFKIPWLHRPYIYNVRSTPRSIKSLTGSRGMCLAAFMRFSILLVYHNSCTDLQMVDINLRVIFRPMVHKLPEVYRTLGLDYDER